MNEVVYLTVAEVANLKGCSQQYVKRIIGEGKLLAESIIIQGRGNASKQYRIPLTALGAKLQIKYKRRQKKLTEAACGDERMDLDKLSKIDELPEIPVDFEAITALEREQIVFWKGLLEEWRSFRSNSPLPNAEADNAFVSLTKIRLADTHPHISLSVRALYRKWKALHNDGEGSLIDKRGKHGKHAKKLTDEMLDIFEYYYLDNSQKKASLCVFLTELELERRYGTAPDMPSFSTFERAARNIPIPHLKYFREGQKAFIEDCAPYIRRMYDDLEPNDIWVADGHTFDIMVLGKDNKPFRPHLSAFMDVRTRKMMGWVITDKLSGDSTIYALKRGAEAYGLPKIVYGDNGREYLFHDFAADKGFRKKAKRDEGDFMQPTILAALSIEYRASLPRNARAKAVERAFLTIKETFSKLFPGYTGGSIAEKPDSLKKQMAQPENLIGIDEFIGQVDTYIKGFYNKQPHNGEGMWGRSPDEAFSELMDEMRVVPNDKLHLMFMRYSKGTVKVGKNGVSLKVYGEKLQYSNPYLWEHYFGRDVYVRYSPDDLSSVRVYNTDNQFICEAVLDEKVSYHADKDTVQAKAREKNAQVKTVRNYKKIKDVEAQDALTAVLTKAAGDIVIKKEVINPSLYRMEGLHEASERKTLQKAVGAEIMEQAAKIKIDWGVLTGRVKK